MNEERFDSAALAAAIGSIDFSDCAATVIGYGFMGAHYVAALRRLGIRRIRVCTRSLRSVESLSGARDVEVVTGGFGQLALQARDNEIGIVAVPTALAIDAAERLVTLGFKRLLIEKPVSFYSNAIERLAASLRRQNVIALVAYNRVTYPSFYEVKAQTDAEGGITSCTYTFTEMIKPNWTEIFPAEELAHWGIANSLHVMSMAHGLIGLPKTFETYRAGNRIPWHPSGSVFVGGGISERSIPFSYQADWGSTGRWSVEVHTAVSSYRFCPLEEVRRRTTPMADWETMPVAAFAADIKAGVLEEVAAMLHPDVLTVLHLISLEEACILTRYGESVFGYATNG